EKSKEDLAKECEVLADNALLSPSDAIPHLKTAAKALGVKTDVLSEKYSEYSNAGCKADACNDNGTKNADCCAKLKAFKEAIDNVQRQCEINASSSEDSKEDEAAAKKENRKRSLINMAGAAVVGTAGTLIVNRLTKDIQDANLDADKKKAYNEWMDNVGKHIHCYIGGDEAGQYGDIITTSME
ncbi:MAG: hypothetical protein II219_01505, partial [Alphaproteobacteria bacterium]|nr:hypothetical protein [Alphaproteobacteria bacterium]